MVKSHVLNRSTLASAIIGVVPKETSNGSNIEDDKKCMHSVGTAGIVVQVTGTNWPRPAYTLLVTGLCRFSLDNIVQESPYLVGIVKQLDKLPGEETGKFKLHKIHCLMKCLIFRSTRRKFRIN